MEIEILPYITVITAIVAAYFAYINQLKLKTIELLFERRLSVLTDIELFIKLLFRLRADLDSNGQSEELSSYFRDHFHEGLILFHKIKGANFGGTTDIIADSFLAVIQEHSIKNKLKTQQDLKNWLDRTTNLLSVVYAMAHSQNTKELEYMAFSFVRRLFLKWKKRLKVDKTHNKIIA